MKKDKMVGKIFESNNYGRFKVIGYKRKGKYNRKYYKVKFIKTGFITFSQKIHIKEGRVKDYKFPNKYGVGFLGKKYKKIKNKRSYRVWNSMLSRCYNKNSNDYKSYGGKGITVCKRWHNFTNFLKDLSKIEGYDEDLFNKGELELDKDLKQKGILPKNKVYSLETCLFLNLDKHYKVRTESQKDFKGVSPNGIIYYGYNQHEFARKHNLDVSSLNMCLNNKRNHTNGWEFEYINKE